MSIAFSKVDSFITEVCAGTHTGAINAATDDLYIYLSNATMSAASDAVKADAAEFAGGTGYTAGGFDIANARSKTGGVITLTGTGHLWTVGAGGWAQFQNLILYNNTAANDPLWGWWALPAPLTLSSGDTFEAVIGATLGTFS